METIERNQTLGQTEKEDPVNKKFTEPDQTPAQPEKENLKGKKFTAMLSYLSWLTVVPMVYSSESDFIKYHANQGLVLAIAETIWVIATFIVSKIIWTVSKPTSLLVEFTMWACLVGVFGMLSIIGIINVLRGKEKPVPTFGKIKIWK